jgi:hypothetical protein
LCRQGDDGFGGGKDRWMLNRHARAKRGHLRLELPVKAKTWMAGSSPAMTVSLIPVEIIVL